MCFLFTIVFTLVLNSCSSSDYLDAKPDAALIVPNTLDDLQAILDNDRVMNGVVQNEGIVPSLGEISADDYFINDESRFDILLKINNRNAYTWQADVYEGMDNVLDWNLPYKSIFYANVVLDQLANIQRTTTNQIQYDQIKGSALFYRAHHFYQLAQIFAPNYVAETAQTELGIPLRLSADINEDLHWSTLEETYNKIIDDLNVAKTMLPLESAYKTRPSKHAVYALLSRIFLTMGQYNKALSNADSCLEIKNVLLNYKYVNGQLAYPFERFNDEVIFHVKLIAAGGPLPLIPSLASIDTVLYQSYDLDDYRRILFFRNSPNRTDVMDFRGSYDGSYEKFAGLTTNEVLLNRSEAAVRLGNIQQGFDDLNRLLENRLNNFNPLIPPNNEEDALSEILKERRKELVMRGLRWSDLRRLNTDTRFSKTLVRKLKGHEYTLPPGDKRYTFPIPQNVLSLNPRLTDSKN